MNRRVSLKRMRDRYCSESKEAQLSHSNATNCNNSVPRNGENTNEDSPCFHIEDIYDCGKDNDPEEIPRSNCVINSDNNERNCSNSSTQVLRGDHDLQLLLSELHCSGADNLPDNLLLCCLKQSSMYSRLKLQEFVEVLPQLRPLIAVMSLILNDMRMVLAAKAGCAQLMRCIEIVATAEAAAAAGKESNQTERNDGTLELFTAAPPPQQQSQRGIMSRVRSIFTSGKAKQNEQSQQNAGDSTSSGSYSICSDSDSGGSGNGSGIWTAAVCVAAAEYGHVDCLLLAHQRGCSWSPEVCTRAARHGHLDCLQLAHESGCSWSCEVIEAALLKDRRDCLLYAIQHGCPIPNIGSNGCNSIGSRNFSRSSVKRQQQQQAVFAQQLARRGLLDCLEAAHERWLPLTTAATIAATSEDEGNASTTAATSSDCFK